MKLKISFEVKITKKQIGALAAAWRSLVPDADPYSDEDCALQYLTDKAEAVVSEAVDDRRCRKCGCTHDEPCEEGCSWVGADLCSACA